MLLGTIWHLSISLDLEILVCLCLINYCPKPLDANNAKLGQVHIGERLPSILVNDCPAYWLEPDTVGA